MWGRAPQQHIHLQRLRCSDAEVAPLGPDVAQELALVQDLAQELAPADVAQELALAQVVVAQELASGDVTQELAQTQVVAQEPVVAVPALAPMAAAPVLAHGAKDAWGTSKGGVARTIHGVAEKYKRSQELGCASQRNT